MGEARQRRLAKEAGRPWPKDAPLPPRELPWYMDPYCPPPPPRRLATQDFKKIEEERSPLVTVDSRGDDGHLQRLAAMARRRPNMFQIMALLAASSLDDVRKPR